MRKVGRIITLATITAAVGSMAVSADATPGSGVSATLLAQGTATKPIHIHNRGATDVVVRQITIEPGGTTGWHYHDGRLMGIVMSGALTHFNKNCTSTVHTAGHSFMEPDGRKEVHMGTNRGTVPVVLMVTYFIPTGMPLSQDAPAPACAK
ncbi:MAG TPA: cupin domain-containing protein [Streptosporangiaceae bacterium]|jgi:quercetin dioxygenase-like cupin family protein|nr:cupin domain-containing protein [Streptosporangiaceae bacterium]